jgi:hypothetical protein
MEPSTFATLASVGLNLFGANKAQSAARESAQASIEAAKIAAEAAKFKPYSISTGFGTSFFDENKQEAGYTLDPTLQAFRNAMYGGAGEFMGQIQTDPQAAAQNYYNQQMALQQGGRGAEDIALRQQQLQSGRIGLGLSGAAMGAGAGTGYVNPEQYQRDLARSMADQQLAAQSTQMAQADIDRAIARGTGLLQTGLGIEEYGLKPLQIGADIGNRAATAGANQAQALLAGGQGAANANLAGGLAGAGMFGNLGASLMRQNFNPVTGQPIK